MQNVTKRINTYETHKHSQNVAIKPFCSCLPHLVLLCCASGFLLQSQAFLLCHIFATHGITKSAATFAQLPLRGYLYAATFARLPLRNYFCATIFAQLLLCNYFRAATFVQLFLRNSKSWKYTSKLGINLRKLKTSQRKFANA